MSNRSYVLLIYLQIAILFPFSLLGVGQKKKKKISLGLENIEKILGDICHNLDVKRDDKSRSSKKILRYTLGAGVIIALGFGAWKVYSSMKTPKNDQGSGNGTPLSAGYNIGIAIYPEDPLVLSNQQRLAIENRFRSEVSNHGDVDRAIDSVCALYPGSHLRFVGEISGQDDFYSSFDAVFPPEE